MQSNSRPAGRAGHGTGSAWRTVPRAGSQRAVQSVQRPSARGEPDVVAVRDRDGTVPLPGSGERQCNCTPSLLTSAQFVVEQVLVDARARRPVRDSSTMRRSRRSRFRAREHGGHGAEARPPPPTIPRWGDSAVAKLGRASRITAATMRVIAGPVAGSRAHAVRAASRRTTERNHRGTTSALVLNPPAVASRRWCVDTARSLASVATCAHGIHPPRTLATGSGHADDATAPAVQAALPQRHKAMRCASWWTDGARRATAMMPDSLKTSARKSCLSSRGDRSADDGKRSGRR